MPAKSKALFMRIQQNQMKSEDGEEEADKTQSQQKETDPEDNWYSSDEEEGGGKKSQSEGGSAESPKLRIRTENPTVVIPAPSAISPEASNRGPLLSSVLIANNKQNEAQSAQTQLPGPWPRSFPVLRPQQHRRGSQQQGSSVAVEHPGPGHQGDQQRAEVEESPGAGPLRGHPAQEEQRPERVPSARVHPRPQPEGPQGGGAEVQGRHDAPGPEVEAERVHRVRPGRAPSLPPIELTTPTELKPPPTFPTETDARTQAMMDAIKKVISEVRGKPADPRISDPLK
ncbi:hypothetical protein BSL78_02466 [Apostichopus japonicus]|uniref:Uncharacterized protein n=1 Tax=Stichopus japonicus TaxID=307972 RepID=A0A2G8LK83_STIJA|nr:hypothetical protein BSL78_02466 [Apostichopus japonicus]